MKIGQASAHDANSAPVVTTLAGDVADEAVAEAGDDRGEQRQEDEELDHVAVQPFIRLTSSTAIVPRPRK